MSNYEGEIVKTIFRYRIRLYLGHTIYPGRRIRKWVSEPTRGIYMVPWRDRVLGLQWRKIT